MYLNQLHRHVPTMSEELYISGRHIHLGLSFNGADKLITILALLLQCLPIASSLRRLFIGSSVHQVNTEDQGRDIGGQEAHGPTVYLFPLFSRDVRPAVGLT